MLPQIRTIGPGPAAARHPLIALHTREVAGSKPAAPISHPPETRESRSSAVRFVRFVLVVRLGAYLGAYLERAHDSALAPRARHLPRRRRTPTRRRPITTLRLGARIHPSDHTTARRDGDKAVTAVAQYRHTTSLRDRREPPKTPTRKPPVLRSWCVPGVFSHARPSRRHRFCLDAALLPAAIRPRSRWHYSFGASETRRPLFVGIRKLSVAPRSVPWLSLAIETSVDRLA